MSVKNIQKIIKDKEIDYVDLRFTDPRGKLQHVTMDAKVVDDDMLEEGIFFDGSSIAIDDPSKNIPSSNMSSSTTLASIVTC